MSKTVIVLSGAIGSTGVLLGCAVDILRTAPERIEATPLQADSSVSNGRRASAGSTPEIRSVDWSGTCDPSGETPLADDNSGEAGERERIGEASQHIKWREAICQTSMNVGGALGCAAVGLYCTSATTITVGGATLPCALVTVAACSSLAAMVEAYKAHGCTAR
jgi:hypothetical protein